MNGRLSPIAIASGPQQLDRSTGSFSRFLHDSRNPHSLGHNSFHAEGPGSQSVVGVNKTYEDADGVLWLCTVDRGLPKLDRERKKFIRYANQPANPSSLPHDTVHTEFEDREGVMRVGTESGNTSCHPRR